MSAPTLTEFLLARIAEDEQRAHDEGAAAMTGHRWKHYPEDAYYEIQSTTLGQAKRLVAECEAKRRVIAMLEEWDVYTERAAMDAVVRALAFLALPYAEHPDYRDEWKP